MIVVSELLHPLPEFSAGWPRRENWEPSEGSKKDFFDARGTNPNKGRHKTTTSASVDELVAERSYEYVQRGMALSMTKRANTHQFAQI